MKYILHLPSRPWSGIKNGTKKVEGRVFRGKTPYHHILEGDTIVFINEDTYEKLEASVVYIHHYPDARSMLEQEGIENVLSSGSTLDEGIEIYNNFTGYAQNIKKNGIYAIGVEAVISYN